MNNPPPNFLPHFGQTRTAVQRGHAFIAPDGQVETTLPSWKGSMVVTLISPQMGARFSQYLAHMQPGGEGTPPLSGVERFIYVLAGEVGVTTEADKFDLSAGGFAFLPADDPHFITAQVEARLNVFERRYIASESSERVPIVVGAEAEVAGEAFLGDGRVTVKRFLPDDAKFDMAVNTMTFKPGATLPFAETHVMEHGLLMLSGGGIYRLEDNWYPIQTGDVLWMGPYCPQWFGALGREDASYLLYKEANRDVFQFEKES